MTSTKTTLAGIIGGLAIIFMQAYYMLDMDPSTNFDFASIVEGLGLMGIGWFARDHDVSSEEAGLKKEGLTKLS